MLTQSWSGKSAVFLMESTLTSHGSSKSNKTPSDGRGILDYYNTSSSELLNLTYFRAHRTFIQLTLVISNSMGPWKKFESTVVRLKRSYENTWSVVCLMTKGRQLEQNFEELKPALHVPILGTILNIFDVFVAVFFFSLLNSLNLVERLITSRYLFCVYEYVYLTYFSLCNTVSVYLQ